MIPNRIKRTARALHDLEEKIRKHNRLGRSLADEADTYREELLAAIREKNKKKPHLVSFTFAGKAYVLQEEQKPESMPYKALLLDYITAEQLEAMRDDQPTKAKLKMDVSP